LKTIVYATDFSENSISALKYAYALSTKMNAHLWVIHVYNQATLNFDLADPYLLPFNIDLTEPYLLPNEENNKQKQFRLEEFCKKHLGINFKSNTIEIDVFENNSIVDGIISKATELKADLIIAGMTGHSIINDFLLGSVSKELIEKSPYPILAIPTEANLNDIKKIVYATDFEEEDVLIISKLVEIVTPLEPTIHITHISTEKEHHGNQQMQWFKEMVLQQVNYNKLEFYTFFEEDIYNALCTYCDDINADLVVMLERKEKNIFMNIFHQDLVKKMKVHTSIPLMSFNEITP